MLTKRSRDPGNLLVKRCPRDDALSSALVPRDDRVAAVTVPQEILGEVEPCAEEPARSKVVIRRGHAIEPAHDLLPRLALVVLFSDNAREPPHIRPELFRVQNRPVVQVAVIREPRGAHERSHVRLLHSFRRWNPDRIRHRDRQ